MSQECACIILTLTLESSLTSNNMKPGHVRAKIYFEKGNLATRLRSQIASDNFYQSRSDTLLANFVENEEAIFGHGEIAVRNSYVDVQLPRQLSIVMVQISDQLKTGRVTSISARSSQFGWISWTRTLSFNEDRFPGNEGGLVNNVFCKNDSFAKVADVLRFNLKFETNEIDRYRSIHVEKVALQVFNTSIFINPPDLKCQKCGEIKEPETPQFPPETWLKIVNHFDCKLSALVALSGTCRQWRRLFSSPLFYSSIDLKPCSSKFPNASKEFLDFLVERCRDSVQHLRISWLTSWPSSNKNQGDEIGPFLRQLKPGILSTFIAENCCALNDFALRWLIQTQPNIQTLRIDGCPSITAEGYQPISKLRKLCRLSLANSNLGIIASALLPLVESGGQNLQVFECTETALIEYTPNADSFSWLILPKFVVALVTSNVMTTLTIVSVKFRDVDRDTPQAYRLSNFLKCCFSNCPRLEEFYVDQACGGFSGDDFVAALAGETKPLAQLCPNLRKFSIIYFFAGETPSRIGGIQFFETLANCFTGLSNLERLAIACFEEEDSLDSSNWDLYQLLANLPNLRQLFVWKDTLAGNFHEITAIQNQFATCRIDVRRSVRDRADPLFGESSYYPEFPSLDNDFS